MHCPPDSRNFRGFLRGQEFKQGQNYPQIVIHQGQRKQQTYSRYYYLSTLYWVVFCFSYYLFLFKRQLHAAMYMHLQINSRSSENRVPLKSIRSSCFPNKQNKFQIPKLILLVIYLRNPTKIPILCQYVLSQYCGQPNNEPNIWGWSLQAIKMVIHHGWFIDPLLGLQAIVFYPLKRGES